MVRGGYSSLHVPSSGKAANARGERPAVGWVDADEWLTADIRPYALPEALPKTSVL
ncbi:MAG: hypothetical protein L0323_00675 [Planctomycetes bacterium]|nr:hypothetical protein [Planctomycetota bacterium]